MSVKSETLAEWYLRESAGNVMRYQYGLRIGERIGQAFYNALSDTDQKNLTGRLNDPFYQNTGIAVERAISFLCSKDAGR